MHLFFNKVAGQHLFLQNTCGGCFYCWLCEFPKIQISMNIIGLSETEKTLIQQSHKSQTEKVCNSEIFNPNELLEIYKPWIEQLNAFSLEVLFRVSLKWSCYSQKSDFWNFQIHILAKLKKNTDFPAGIYLLKVNNRNTRTRCEICLKLTMASFWCLYS